ncbi:hypothetical protein ACWCRF_04025 [Streptomyces sp. NPDC002405]|uniref:hypothetical protein n=1 Tax=unclassified Streptomyces TaxID=2593676 RepID=UPI003679D2DD
MTEEQEHRNAVLAEILLSRKVGVAHTRLVGDLISVQAQLSMGMQGRAGLSLDARVGIVEAVLPLEEAYHSAWRAVAAAPDIERRVPELRRLQASLTDAVEGVVAVARLHGIQAEPRRLDAGEG